MKLVAEAIKGTQDALPKESYKWQYVESVVKDVAKQFDFKEIRTPVFEKTELFQRGVGDTTDVVQKEMYTFDDKGGRSITLRPEGTAGAMRSVLEHGLFNEALPIKAFYNTSCYRYEKPQAGRLREHHQFGCELLGANSLASDVEIVLIAFDFYKSFGIEPTIHINFLGCDECKKKYCINKENKEEKVEITAKENNNKIDQIVKICNSTDEKILGN